MEERSRYFQEIARRFLAERGAPFFLSSIDIDLIAGWERMGIPLTVVLEGIERTLESRRSNRAKKGKIHSLSFCRLHVLKAFERYREKKVGIQEKRVQRDEKRRSIEQEVRTFLENLPPELSFLEGVYRNAQEILSRRVNDEGILEQMDEEVEDLLFRNCPEQEKKAAERAYAREFPQPPREESSPLLKVKLVKLLRDKYRIPYLSFYYY